jgi:hypothetical protein
MGQGHWLVENVVVLSKALLGALLFLGPLVAVWALRTFGWASTISRVKQGWANTREDFSSSVLVLRPLGASGDLTVHVRKTSIRLFSNEVVRLNSAQARHVASALMQAADTLDSAVGFGPLTRGET